MQLAEYARARALEAPRTSPETRTHQPPSRNTSPADCLSTWSGKPHRPSSQSRIRCTRTPARPICRFTPPAAKNKSAAGGAPAARGGGLARQTPAKNGWPSSCRARGHRLAGPPPPDSKAPCGNAPCPTRGPAGATPRPTLALAIAPGFGVAAGRSPRSTSHPPRRPAAKKSKRQGGSQGRAGKPRQNQIRYPARPLDGLHSFQAAPARPWQFASRAAIKNARGLTAPPCTPAGAGARPPRKTKPNKPNKPARAHYRILGRSPRPFRRSLRLARRTRSPSASQAIRATPARIGTRTGSARLSRVQMNGKLRRP